MPSPRLRTIFLALMTFALGCLGTAWLLPGRAVQAATAPDAAGSLSFQFENLGPQSALTLYNPADHTLTVYQGATAGDTHLNCSFQYRITRPGAPIERHNCQPGTLLP